VLNYSHDVAKPDAITKTWQWMIGYVADAIGISITCMSFAILGRRSRYIGGKRIRTARNEDSGGRREARVSIYRSRKDFYYALAQAFPLLIPPVGICHRLDRAFKSNTRLPSVSSPFDAPQPRACIITRAKFFTDDIPSWRITKRDWSSDQVISGFGVRS